MNKNSKIIISLILILAAILRLWGITGGLPDVSLHIDEATMVYTALSLPSWNGALWTIGAGIVVPQILFVVYSIYFVVGKLFGLFTTPESFLIAHLTNPTNIFLISRGLNALLGVFSVYFIFHLGKKWFGEVVGIFAALFLAVAFMHVRESHYIKGDVLVAFISMAIFNLACRMAEKSKTKYYIVAGILGGMAFGVKYYPVLLMSCFLLAHIYITRKKKTSLLSINLILMFITALIVVFLIILPTLLYRFNEATTEFLYWGKYVSSKSITQPVAFAYIFDHLRNGMGTLIWLLVIPGVIFSLKKIRKFQYLLLMAYPALFLSTVEFWGKHNYSRHALTILPFLILFSALGITFIIKEKKLNKLFVILLAVGVIVPTVVRGVKFDRYLNSKDTRGFAKEWIENNVPKDSRVVIEGSLKPYIPEGAAPLFLSSGAIDREIERANKVGYAGTSLKALKVANADKITYEILSTPRIDRTYDILSGEQKQLEDASFYVKGNYKIIATDSWVHFSELNHKFAADFNSKYKEVASFSPTVLFSINPHEADLDYKKTDSLPLFGPIISGPEVKIFKYVRN